MSLFLDTSDVDVGETEDKGTLRDANTQEKIELNFNGDVSRDVTHCY